MKRLVWLEKDNLFLEVQPECTLTMGVAVLLIISFTIGYVSGQQYGDHRGIEFVVAFIDNPVAVAHSLYIISEEDADVTVTSDYMGTSDNMNMNAFSPETHELDKSFHYQGGNEFAVERKAVHITSTKAISVYGSEVGVTSGDGFLAIPMDRLSGHYIAVSRDADPSPSHIVIVGTENHTNITIQIRLRTGSCTSSNYTSGTTLTKTIQRFDVVGLACSGDITGTVITSDRAIAVLSGNEMATFPATSTNSDMLIEMLIPVETFGKSYVITLLAASTLGVTYRIVSAKNNTIVRLGGFQIFTLDAFEYGEFEAYSLGNHLLETTAPVMLVIYDTIIINSVGDAFMAIIPPTDRFFKRPFYEFTQIVLDPLNDVYVTIYFNTTIFPGITFGVPNMIVPVPNSDMATLSTLASDVKGSQFPSDVLGIGLVISANPRSNAGYGYLGGMDFTFDPCESAPCLNDGQCMASGAFFLCQCLATYTGDTCEIDISVCSSVPCMNNGTCYNNGSSYACECLGGYTGTDCETEIDECESGPCLNNGTCLENVNGFTCDCMAGFTGSDCQTDIDECESTPCMNNGTCFNEINAYICACVAGYAGLSCETDINECETLPCGNGGTCVDEVNAYTCICPVGFTGETCESDIDECESTPCMNNGTCVNELNAYICSCVAGFTGLSCETDIDDCETLPCRNGGTCIDEVNAYTCICPAGFTGETCESDIQIETTENPSTFSTDIFLETSGDFQLTSSVDHTLETSVLQTTAPVQSQTYSYTKIIDLDNTRIMESGITVLTTDFQPSMYETDTLNGMLVSCNNIAPTESQHRCLCTRYENHKYEVTEEKKEEIKEEIQKKLLLDTTNLTKTMLKYISMPDNRPSARNIGSAGIVVLVLVATLILIPDVLATLKSMMGIKKRVTL